MEEFKLLIKNSPAFKRLNKNAQSYLFCSFDSLATGLAAAAYIEDEAGIKFSSELNSPHPDIIILPKEDKVLVADIELLTSSASTTPLSLKHKYFVINAAQTMNDACANKLLKTLEEPPSHVKIFLLSESETIIKPTIRSRCQILRLDSLSLPKDDGLTSEFHLNSLYRLLRAKQGHYNKPLTTALNLLLFLKKSDQIILHLDKLNVDKDSFKDILDMIELLLHESAMHLSIGQIRLKSMRPDIIKIAAFYGLDALIRLQDATIRAKKRLMGFANLNSIIDELLFSLLSTRQKHNF